MSVTDIPADLVKRLRDETSAPMMDCKRALQESDADFDEAKRLLRERGMAAAGKKAGRATTEGKIMGSVGEYGATLVAIGAETEPVSNNDEFLAFAQRVLEAVEESGPDAVEQLESDRLELISRLGENIVIAGVTRYETGPGENVLYYIHRPAQKTGAMVMFEGGSPDLGKQLAMHITAASPRWVRREDVPQDLVESERQILENSDEVQSKPEQARPKIVEGMLNKRFFGAYPGGVLLEQDWIHDSSKKVAQALEEGDLKVIEFVRYALAE